MSHARLQTNLSSKHHELTLNNPIIPASGTFGYGSIMQSFYDINQLGAVLTKSITTNPRNGNPSPRIYETPSGLLNSVGLENKGLKWFLDVVQPFLLSLKTSKWVSIAGFTIEEFESLADTMDKIPVDALEVNVSCPNIHENGVQFCQNMKILEETLRRVRKATSHFLVAKIALETTPLSQALDIIEQQNFDAVCIGNTIRGVAIDPETRKPFFHKVFAGLSGPAIKPIALRVVWEAYTTHPALPIIGCGGVACSNDVIEFLAAGATAVEVGTMNLVDPCIIPSIINGLEEYCHRHQINLSSIIGSAHHFVQI